MNKKIEPLSGFRDMLAEASIPRQKMIEKIKGVYEVYGFVPLETPAVERFDTLTGKYGTEGDKLIYRLAKRGDEEGETLALRYDLTVPLARVVAQHGSEIVFPYKRYQFSNVWRGDRPQAGRYREFMQFDADVVGVKSPVADAEIVAMMADSMEKLGVKAVVRVNNRLILDGLCEMAGLKDEMEKRDFIGTIDKTEKVGADRVIEELGSNFGLKVSEIAKKYLSISGSFDEKIKQTEELLKGTTADEGVTNLREVFNLLTSMDYKGDKVTYDPTIARGLDYYTGIIFETQLIDLPKIGSVCSGGRYDHLVAEMGGPDMPAVGTSIGFDRLFTAMETLGLIEKTKTKTRVLITNFGAESMTEQIKALSSLRRLGIPTEISYESGRIGKQFKLADKLGIPYVLVFGEEEIKREVVQIKNLQTGEQKEMKFEDVIKELTR